MKIIVRKFGCFKNFLLYLETLLHITRLVFVIRKKLMSESSQNSKQILLDGKNGSPNSKQHHLRLSCAFLGDFSGLFNVKLCLFVLQQILVVFHSSYSDC